MKVLNLRSVFWFFGLTLVLFSGSACKRKYTPKPSGYFRIDFPKKEYRAFAGNFPYSFEYPVYGKIEKYKGEIAEPYWMNIDFPEYKGKIYISYFRLNHDLSKYFEESRNLAYKHTIKADAINEELVQDKKRKIYGIIYHIKGNTASSINFVLTDSMHNFLRGALYFDTHPNKDSLAPVIDFFQKDIDHLIATIKWK
ncbi:MAG: gliding motility lipoprotein GldD [Bacteroidota bacterium]|nr:gliding motility lipoprotein GldD [Bacteroidota bacterium]MDP4272765.1 gliding motility lipoprotein GldD [Bacteroidota bacterium]